MPKQISVQCPEHVADIIISSLKWFVERNYPRGAAECSIAAREALLNVVDRFERELRPHGRSAYSSRIRAFLCEAVKDYLAMQGSQTGQDYTQRRQIVIDVCRGHSDGRGFDDAERLDNARSGRAGI
jgi:hypothetical protein